MNKIITLTLFFLGLFSCSNNIDTKQLADLKMNFIRDLNHQQAIEKYYWRQGGLFVEEQLFKHRDSIEAQIKKRPLIHRFETLKLVEHDSSNCFEIGYYLSDSSSQKTSYLIAWKKEKNSWLKELEVLYSNEVENNIPTSEIDLARSSWENYSNKHQPDSFVQHLYSPNCIYFNDGYIYRGTTALKEKYAYMSDADWRIRLASKSTMQVSDSLFYDIGQYASSGIGHYFILWQLQKDNQWKVLLDFNF